MASTPRMIPLAIIFLLLALIAIIAERNPSQPGDEPAFTKVQEVAAGDTLHLEGGVSVCVEQPGFLNSLMPFGTVIGVHTYLIVNPEDNEKNCLSVLQVEIETDRDLELAGRLSAGILTPNGKFYAGDCYIPDSSGRLPSETLHEVPAGVRRVYFVSTVPRRLAKKSGEFQFCLYADGTKYTLPFSPGLMEPMLKAGDTLENGDYRLVLVDARQGDRISASNDPETYMFQGAKSSYNGYIEIVADITNLSGRTENILRSVECRRVFDGYVEGPLSSSIMEDEDMTHFTPMGLYGAGASGSRSGIHIYHGVGAVNNSEIPPGETRRVHFFWDRSDEAAAQEEHLIRIHMGGSDGYVRIA